MKKIKITNMYIYLKVNYTKIQINFFEVLIKYIK